MYVTTLLGCVAPATIFLSTLCQRVSPAEQMTVAMLLILWVSALASAFIDNIPFTAAIVSCDMTTDVMASVTLFTPYTIACTYSRTRTCTHTLTLNHQCSHIRTCKRIHIVLVLRQLLVSLIYLMVSLFVTVCHFCQIPVIVDVAQGNPCVSLRPLVWALALGACLGGE